MSQQKLRLWFQNWASSASEGFPVCLHISLILFCSLLSVPVTQLMCILSVIVFGVAVCSEEGANSSYRGWAMPRGVYGWEQGREAVTAGKGTRRKRSVLTAASSLCTSEALVLGHKMTCCSCSSLPPSTTACSHCLHGLSYSSDPLSALSACWYLVLATSRQSSTSLTSWKNAVSDGSTKCCSQEEIKANG